MAYHLKFSTWYTATAKRAARRVKRVNALGGNNPANPAITNSQLTSPKENTTESRAKVNKAGKA